MQEEKKDISIIKKANDDMLAYFNQNYNTDLDNIRTLETELMEVNVRLDELNKTRNIYAFTTNSRKNVFSPIISDTVENTKEAEISSQITDLELAKTSLENKIEVLRTEMKFLKKQLTVLKNANASIQALSSSPALAETEEPDSSDAFQFVNEENKNSDSVSHGTNILMLEAFDKTYLATMLDKKVKKDLQIARHKLELLSYLISSDPERAKLTVNDILSHFDKTDETLNLLFKKLYYDFDSSKPIWMILDNFVMANRDNHPECVLEADIQCLDYEQNISYIKSLSLIMLLDIFFDNIFKHSNANCIVLKVLISETMVEVYINDDGVGIAGDYYTKSIWYSSLHKAHEIIYLLDGTLVITGDYTTGTTIRFSFSAN